MTTPRYALLIPVKDGSGAKSRLGVGSAEVRARLMAAFARDAITAAAACDLVSVHVVGDAAGLADLLAGIDCQVVPDEGEGDLNRALARAAARVATPDVGIAVMLADLPCLRTEDVRTVFAAVDRRSFVPDASGTGTTFLIAPAGTELDPHFGAGSALAHADSGGVEVGVDLPSLRLDVDTTDDLTEALRFGVGARTAAVAASLT